MCARPLRVCARHHRAVQFAPEKGVPCPRNRLLRRDRMSPIFPRAHAAMLASQAVSHPRTRAPAPLMRERFEVRIRPRSAQLAEPSRAARGRVSAARERRRRVRAVGGDQAAARDRHPRAHVRRRARRQGRCARCRRSSSRPIRRRGGAERLVGAELRAAAAASATPEEYMKAVLAEWERLNVTAVVMGDEAVGAAVEGGRARPGHHGHVVHELADRRRVHAARRATHGVHERRLQGHGRDRPPVPGALAERHVGGPVLRAGGGARHPGRASTWARAARGARTSRCRSSAARWATRCCSRTCSPGTRSSVCGSCTPATR